MPNAPKPDLSKLIGKPQDLAKLQATAAILARSTTPDWETILRDINAEYRAEDVDYRRLHSLRDKAAARLAEINGWHISKASAFAPADIGRGRARDYYSPGAYPVFDHEVHFRGMGRCAALLTEPYGDPDEIWQAAAEIVYRHGNIAVHRPPQATAAIWGPGHPINVLCFTRGGHVMRWLPEQYWGIGIRGLSLTAWARGVKADDEGSPAGCLLYTLAVNDERLPVTFDGLEDFTAYIRGRSPYEAEAAAEVWEHYLAARTAFALNRVPEKE